MREHVLVPAQLLGVARFSPEYLTPPSCDVRPMLFAHAPWEERREQVVALDPVVEGVDQAPDRLVTSRPFMERLHRLPPGHSIPLDDGATDVRSEPAVMARLRYTGL